MDFLTPKVPGKKLNHGFKNPLAGWVWHCSQGRSYYEHPRMKVTAFTYEDMAEMNERILRNDKFQAALRGDDQPSTPQTKKDENDNVICDSQISAITMPCFNQGYRKEDYYGEEEGSDDESQSKED